VSDLDLLHDGPHQLLLVLGDVQGVVVIEGRVASYEEERSSEDPEDDPPGTSQEEEGDGAEADDGVLLGQTDLVTCGITISVTTLVSLRTEEVTSHRELPLTILEAGNVGGPATGRYDDQQEGRREETVEDQHQEHQHVVGLEILDILVQSLGQSPGRWRSLEVGCVEEHSKRSDVGSSLAEPFLDCGLGDVDGDGETHAAQQRRLARAVSLLAAVYLS